MLGMTEATNRGWRCNRREEGMIAGFVFLKCELGQVETVANQIVEIDGVSEIYSISGNYDLLAKVYVNRYEEFATMVPQWIHHISGIRETSTLITFNAFKLVLSQQRLLKGREVCLCDGCDGTKAG
jgi:DNA-binding Lrp family transcriptional regulator